MGLPKDFKSAPTSHRRNQTAHTWNATADITNKASFAHIMEMKRNQLSSAPSPRNKQNDTVLEPKRSFFKSSINVD